jgi:hypothetical protein
MIRQAGAEAAPRYAITEAGAIGLGCLVPGTPDDVHLLSDRQALIQPGPSGEAQGIPSHALLISTLLPTAPFIFINFSPGDQAVVVQRECGCPLERLNWTTHLQTIRSYEKLTCEGMTFMDTDLIRVLETVLPTRFGGTPIDYQLIEKEGQWGESKLVLLVDPRLGELDHGAVIETFLSEIGSGNGVERVMGQMWRDGRLIEVERRSPQTTASGKILHLHLDRSVTA